MKFSFEDLDVWKLALDLAEKIYTASKKFPKSEMYGVTSQIRRASLSIALNIAEGKGRYSSKEYRQFIFMARGSLYETITLIKMCLKLGYFANEQHGDLMKYCEKIQSKISGLLNYLKSGDYDPRPLTRDPISSS